MAGCGRAEGGGHGYSDVCGQPEWGQGSQIYKCRRCLLAELELVTKWRPIETAPRDGTLILGYDPHWPDPICVIRWSEWGEWHDWSDTHPFRSATHWMPLPASPR